MTVENFLQIRQSACHRALNWYFQGVWRNARLMGIGTFFSKMFGREKAPSESPLHDLPELPPLVVKPLVGFKPENLETAFFEALFDSPIEDQFLSLPQKLMVGVVKDKLSDPDQRCKSVPQLPAIIPRLMRSLRDPESSARDYVTIIDKDPSLSAAVLRLANSAYFNHTDSRITNIERAVVKLGVEGLRAVLSAAVMQPIIQRSSPYYREFGQKLWQHSLCCAVTCEILAKRRGLEPFKVYLLGLSHDVGKITIFSELCKEFRLNSATDKPGCQVFVPLISEFSSQLSAWIARDWDLPMDVCTALDQQLDVSKAKPVGIHARVLWRANLACEFFAAGGHKDVTASAKLIRELDLPTDIFVSLASLAEPI